MRWSGGDGGGGYSIMVVYELRVGIHIYGLYNITYDGQTKIISRNLHFYI